MRAAAQAFYLAFFALLGSSHAEHQAATKSRSTGPDICAIEPKATVSDACASYATLDYINKELAPSIRSLTQKTDFFAYYRLNLFHRVCPFWSDENSMCGNIACAVNTLDHEEDIPEIWRAKELGKLEGPKAEHPGRREQQERQEKPLQGELGENVRETCVVEYDDECDDRDYCVPEDESATAEGDYVSLIDNPERYTGYAGPGVRQVWDAIYRENCFSRHRPSSTRGGKGLSPFGLQASSDLKSVIKQHGRQQALASHAANVGSTEDGLELEFDDECLEKRVFYRVISGMHASISTHICWDYLHKDTGMWGANPQCFQERLHSHPERISNLYFNYALVLRAVAKLRNHLENYTFCSGDIPQDRATKQQVVALADKIASGPEIFDETSMFRDSAATGLKEDFRHRFRNVSRLMDCVGCDKCRLWGKLQTVGYGTALKVLFEIDEKVESGQRPVLRRTEIVALFNTLDRISNSLLAIQEFLKMMGHKSPEASAANAGTADVPSVSHDLEEDWEDWGDHESQKKSNKTKKSLNEAFWEEWYLIWRTFAYVIKGWIGFPRVAFQILVMEASRLWDFWLGMPVKPRTWVIDWPSRDEL